MPRCIVASDSQWAENSIYRAPNPQVSLFNTQWKEQRWKRHVPNSIPRRQQVPRPSDGSCLSIEGSQKTVLCPTGALTARTTGLHCRGRIISSSIGGRSRERGKHGNMKPTGGSTYRQDRACGHSCSLALCPTSRRAACPGT